MSVSLLCVCRSLSPWKVCESTLYVATPTYALFQPLSQPSSKSHSTTSSSQTNTNCEFHHHRSPSSAVIHGSSASTISRAQQHQSNICHCILHTVLNPLDPAAGLLNTVFICPDVLACSDPRCLVKCYSFSALITKAYGTLL